MIRPSLRKIRFERRVNRAGTKLSGMKAPTEFVAVALSDPGQISNTY